MQYASTHDLRGRSQAEVCFNYCEIFVMSKMSLFQSFATIVTPVFSDESLVVLMSQEKVRFLVRLKPVGPEATNEWCSVV